MPRFVVVFDTNVLFSAIGWPGNPRRCVDLARGHKIEAVTCEQIIEELARKLKQKLGFSDRQILETTIFFLGFMRTVPVAGNLKGACADPKDGLVLECAVVAGASHIVSGDRKHLLSMKTFQGVAIVSPADLVLTVESASS
jgi:putative PIN family toxin of toxin-antitoxin system